MVVLLQNALFLSLARQDAPMVNLIQKIARKLGYSKIESTDVFRCSYCGAQFDSRKDLDKHRFGKHGKSVPKESL